MKTLRLSLLAALVSLLASALATAGELRASVKGLKLKVSPNGRYFVDQTGKPFFYLGDTAWLLFQRFEAKEADDYLKDRAGKRFTGRAGGWKGLSP